VGPGEVHGSRQTRLPVEAIEKTLDVLVVERQRLHEQHSGPDPLEANRLAIAYWQRELAEARRSTSASAYKLRHRVLRFTSAYLTVSIRPPQTPRGEPIKSVTGLCTAATAPCEFLWTGETRFSLLAGRVWPGLWIAAPLTARTR